MVFNDIIPKRAGSAKYRRQHKLFRGGREGGSSKTANAPMVPN